MLEQISAFVEYVFVEKSGTSLNNVHDGTDIFKSVIHGNKLF